MNQFEQYFYNQIKSESDSETEKVESKDDSLIIIPKEKIATNYCKEGKKKMKVLILKKR